VKKRPTGDLSTATTAVAPATHNDAVKTLYVAPGSNTLFESTREDYEKDLKEHQKTPEYKEGLVRAKEQEKQGILDSEQMRESDRVFNEHWEWKKKEKQKMLRLQKKRIQKKLQEKNLLFIKKDAAVWYTANDGTQHLANVGGLTLSGFQINISTNTPGKGPELELEEIKKRDEYNEKTRESDFDFEDTEDGIQKLFVPFEEASARLTERTNKYPHIFSYDDSWSDDDSSDDDEYSG